MRANDLIEELRKATDGLLYMSETDEPFKVVHWKSEQGPIDDQRVADLLGHPGGPIELLSLDDFFSNLIKEQDWHGEEEKEDVLRYRRLLSTVKQHLSEAKVLRIGTMAVDILIIGRTPSGEWAGVRTRAVET